MELGFTFSSNNGTRRQVNTLQRDPRAENWTGTLPHLRQRAAALRPGGKTLPDSRSTGAGSGRRLPF